MTNHVRVKVPEAPKGGCQEWSADMPPHDRDRLAAVGPIVRELAWRRTVIPLLGILTAALTVRLAFFTGFVGGDDSSYLAAAADLVERLRWNPEHLSSSRIGFVAVAALGIKLFGTSEFAIVSMVLLASVLTHVLVYLLAAFYYGAQAGLLAAALLAFYPLNMVYSTTLLPDPVLSCVMAGAVLSYVLSERGGSLWGWVGSLAAGLLAGLAFLVKEPGALLLGVFAAVWLAHARRCGRLERRWVAVVAGFLLMLGVELALEYFLVGTTFERYRAASTAVGEALASSDMEREASAWYLYLRSMFVSVYQVGLFFYLVAAALAWACIRKLHLPPVLLAWLLIVLGYLTFGSASLTNYLPLPKQPRYLEAVTVPAVILAAGALRQAVAAGGAVKRALLGALGAYVLTALLCVQFTSSMLRWQFQPSRVAEEWLRVNGLSPVHASLRLANGLFQLSGGKSEISQLPTGSCGEANETVLLILAARDLDGGERRMLEPDCHRWTVFGEIEVRPPALASRSLSLVLAALAHSPTPESVTAKVRQTVMRNAASRVIRVFVPIRELGAG